jgi:hypothetical protein
MKLILIFALSLVPAALVIAGAGNLTYSASPVPVIHAK